MVFVYKDNLVQAESKVIDFIDDNDINIWWLKERALNYSEVSAEDIDGRGIWLMKKSVILWPTQ